MMVLIHEQETLNYWKQTSHVLKYFRAEEEPKARLPSNFINGFLEVSIPHFVTAGLVLIRCAGSQLGQPQVETQRSESRSVYIAKTIPFPSCAPSSMLALNAYNAIL
jgi:hypothetical protein